MANLSDAYFPVASHLTTTVKQCALISVLSHVQQPANVAYATFVGTYPASPIITHVAFPHVYLCPLSL